MNAVHQMLAAKGNMPIRALAGYTGVSGRQLERLFFEDIGVSPKKLADLIRYQILWREVAFSPRFDVQDAVIRYGYRDQAHLLNDFKKYHTMTPAAAKKYALESR